jgi:hypothetical protein
MGLLRRDGLALPLAVAAWSSLDAVVPRMIGT